MPMLQSSKLCVIYRQGQAGIQREKIMAIDHRRDARVPKFLQCVEKVKWAAREERIQTDHNYSDRSARVSDVDPSQAACTIVSMYVHSSSLVLIHCLLAGLQSLYLLFTNPDSLPVPPLHLS